LNAGIHLQAGVAVSKKNFRKAVDRNRIKRFLREAYRLQKNELQDQLKVKNMELAIFFIYTGKEVPVLTEIVEKIKAILVFLTDVTKEENK
jgi:ribonuclease P protein component